MQTRKCDLCGDSMVNVSQPTFVLTNQVGIDICIDCGKALGIYDADKHRWNTTEFARVIIEHLRETIKVEE